MADLNGKVAIVTGAASGIGKAVAELYAENGAQVVVSDIDEENGKKTTRQIVEAGGSAFFVKADVSKPEDCQQLVNKAKEKYGQLDIACNNAGIGGEQNNTADYSLDGWQKVIGINLSSVFYCMKYELEAMQAQGSGSIVNMASILGQVGFGGSTAYVAAKHGVVGLTQNAALEYSAKGIRINSVGPGFISTPMLAQLEEDKDTLNYLVSLHPIGRLGKAKEVAQLVLWLSSEKASFVTGAYYPIDGGYLAR